MVRNPKLPVWNGTEKVLAKVLSNREFEVLLFVARTDMVAKEIANKLTVSHSAVKKYVCRIYEKLGVNSRRQLALLVANNPEIFSSRDNYLRWISERGPSR